MPRHQPLTIDEMKVLSFAQWCELNDISEATGRRLLRSRKGPKVIQLAKARIGIRQIDNRIWQESRVRA
jgi:hypothetical protein